MMQVISRRVNEGLVIGDDIFVTVLDVFQNEVRLGISSPNMSPAYWEETLHWEPEEAAEELHVQYQ
jgi:carbon storage regulator CsrA